MNQYPSYPVDPFLLSYDTYMAAIPYSPATTTNLGPKRNLRKKDPEKLNNIDKKNTISIFN